MNINSIKMKLKKNKYVDTLLRICFYPIFIFNYIKSDYEAERRRKGIKYPQFEWIKDYKNKYNGKRCFIVATGPSLTIKDLDMIKDEYSFGMNTCALALDKTEWRPTFYGIQDEYIYEKLETSLNSMAASYLPEVFISVSIMQKFSTPERFKTFPLHYLDHKMFHIKGFGKYKFSDDCYACIYDGYSITFSLMQLACYMGFKEIYLLGCDCNYNQEKKHFIESGHVDPKYTVMGNKMIYGHYMFKEFADKIGVKVINCTRGGMLDVYPRKSLDDIIDRKEK